MTLNRISFYQIRLSSAWLSQLPFLNKKNTYQRGDPPPFVKEYSSDRATIPDIENDRVGIAWGNDEVSVVACIDDEPSSMIIRNEKPGYSKSIKQPCPWGNPWDETIYLKYFG